METHILKKSSIWSRNLIIRPNHLLSLSSQLILSSSIITTTTIMDMSISIWNSVSDPISRIISELTHSHKPRFLRSCFSSQEDSLSSIKIIFNTTISHSRMLLYTLIPSMRSKWSSWDCLKWEKLQRVNRVKIYNGGKMISRNLEKYFWYFKAINLRVFNNLLIWMNFSFKIWS